MMFAEAMIRIGVQLNLFKKRSGGVGGGGTPMTHDVRLSDDSNRGARIQERVR